MANRLLDLYGLGDQPFYSGDGDVYTTASLMPGIEREQAWRGSAFGKVANWLEGKSKGLEGATMFNPVVMGLEGAGTMNRWLGAAAGHTDQLQTQDVLAPLGLSAMAAPFMPRNALGSAGGRLAPFGKASLDSVEPQPFRYELPEGVTVSRTGKDYTFFDGENQIGNAYVRDLGDRVQVGKIGLDEPYQRRGIGNAFYDQLGDEYRKTVVPDDTLSPAAYEFWRKRDPDAVAGHQNIGQTWSRGAFGDTAGAPLPAITERNAYLMEQLKALEDILADFPGGGGGVLSDQSRSSLPGSIVNALDERNALGSAGGRLAAGAAENALDANPPQARTGPSVLTPMQQARAMRDDARIVNGIAVFDEMVTAPDQKALFGLLGKVSKYRSQKDDKGILRFIIDYDGNLRVQDAAAGTHYTMGDDPILAGWIGRDGTFYARHASMDDVWTFEAKKDYLEKLSGKPVRLMEQQDFERLVRENGASNSLAADQARGALPGTVVNALEDRGIKAYHGSPHDFDEFNTPAHFALEEGLAKAYRASGGSTGQGVPREYYAASQAYKDAGDNIDGALKILSQKSATAPEIAREYYQKAADYLASGGNVGHMYEVRLPEPTKHYNRHGGDGDAAMYADAVAGGHKVISLNNKEVVALDKSVIEVIRKYGIAAAASMYGLEAVNSVMGDQSDIGP